MSQIKAEISLRTNMKLNLYKNVGLKWYQWIPDFYNIRFEQTNLTTFNDIFSRKHHFGWNWEILNCIFAFHALTVLQCRMPVTIYILSVVIWNVYYNVTLNITQSVLLSVIKSFMDFQLTMCVYFLFYFLYNLM